MKQRIAVLLLLVCVLVGCAQNNAPERTATIEVRCDTVLDNLDLLDPDKVDLIPDDGLLHTTTVTLDEGENTALDVVLAALGDNVVYSQEYGYVQGLFGLNEYDCGGQSGWMFSVNDEFPDVGCDSYVVQDGDVIQFRYTCDWGLDLGMEY